MSRRKKPTPRPASTWDEAIDRLVGAEGHEAARAIALHTGLLLVLRAQVPDRASPADLTSADERAFLASLPGSLRPAGRETVRALRALARERRPA